MDLAQSPVVARHARMILTNTEKLSDNEKVLLAGFGCPGEYGEFLESRDDRVECKLEFGDYLWYVHLICLVMDYPFAEVLRRALNHPDIPGVNQAWMAFSKLSEIVKKVGVTKKKNLADLKLQVVELLVLGTASAWAWYRIYGHMEDREDKNAELETVLDLNIVKCEARFGRKYE